jgi:hypothetical protein
MNIIFKIVILINFLACKSSQVENKEVFDTIKVQPLYIHLDKDYEKSLRKSILDTTILIKHYKK